MIYPDSIKFNGEFIIKPHDPETFFKTREGIPSFDPETFLNSSDITFSFNNGADPQQSIEQSSNIKYSKKTIDLIKEQNRLKFDIKKLSQKLQLLKYRDDNETIYEYERKKEDLTDISNLIKQSIESDRMANYEKEQKKIISARKQYLKRIGISNPKHILNIDEAQRAMGRSPNNITKTKRGSTKRPQKKKSIDIPKSGKNQFASTKQIDSHHTRNPIHREIENTNLTRNKLLAQIKGIQSRLNKIEDEFVDMGGDIDDITQVSEWNELERTRKKLRDELDNL